jgi:oligopeptide/dipeptide ABC transporter ATP-binding protein
MTLVPPVVLFRVDNVTRDFRSPGGARVQALRGVGLEIRSGETLGIVGESGSGKTTLVRLLMGLDRAGSGRVSYLGLDVGGSRESQRRSLRKDVQLVFQDPASSLNPRMRVGEVIAEPLRGLRIPGDHGARVRELLEAVGLPESAARRYPHEFSGGQRQRIAIARALAPRPEVLVADEPVSALDLSIRAQILNLLQDLKEQFQLTLVLVSHDLSVVRHMCDRVAVMYLGRIVEVGASEAVFSNPEHPYTRSLLASVPTLAGGLPRALDGQVPSASSLPPGCAFAPRCPLAFDRCITEDPSLHGPADGRLEGQLAACHLAFTAAVERLPMGGQRA